MLLRLFLLFTVVPLVELILLVWIGRHTTWTFTLALIFLPGLTGAILARYQGLRCWRAVREQLARGELPAAALLDSLMILVAGALLITPGVLTDLTGLALLLPPVRRTIRGYLLRRLATRIVAFSQARFRTPAPENDDIIDVEHRSPEGGDGDRLPDGPAQK